MGNKRVVNEKSVENTNSDSLLSKLSVVSLGYRVDPFLRALCSNAGIKSRRSPAINRGYLARMLALEVSFERALLLGQVQQVLSLGAGFDSMFFRLANCGILSPSQNVRYFEVDYPESVHGKNARISKSALLKSFFSHVKCENDCYEYDSGFLTLIGCNMVIVEDLLFKLNQTGFDPRLKTLILTECSTTYIEAAQCQNLLAALTRLIEDFMFISYEQIRPNDAFGRIMVNHFERRNSPLKCVQHYPTIEAHKKRFESLGWQFVSVRTIEEIWRRFMNESEMKALYEAEPFDEAPELISKFLHYVLIVATKTKTDSINDVSLHENPVRTNQASLINIEKVTSNESLRLFGHMAFVLEDKIFIAGGASPDHSRVSALVCLEKATMQVLRRRETDHKWLFSAHAVLNNECFIFGGRGSPAEASQELYKIDSNGEINLVKCQDAPQPRWGHTLTCVGSKLYLVGGRDQMSVFDHIYEFHQRKWILKAKLPCHGLYSHSTVGVGNYLFISGGLKDFTKCEVNEELLIFNVETCTFVTLGKSLLPSRFSHNSHAVDNTLHLIGGVSLSDQDILMTSIDLESLKVDNYVSDTKLSAPMVQHSSIFDLATRSILVFGGGTNCFSFGMHVSPDVMRIKI